MAILDAAAQNSVKGGPSFSLRNRVYRSAWTVTWALLAAWTPAPLFAWRRFLLCAFGARIAPTARVYSSARIWSPENLEMAAFACIARGVTVYSMAKISIGAHAVISQGAHLCAGAHDIEDVHFQLIARPISIGERSWVAAEAFVGPGVAIGDGAVLGARACAFKDLAPWTVYVGNPATPLKPRNVRFPAVKDG